MKRFASSFLAAALLLTATCTAQAQTAEKAAAPPSPKSNLESFSEKSGTVIKRTFTDVGKVKDVQVQVLTFNDVVNQKTLSGIRLEAYASASYGGSTKTAFLDADEIDGLVKALTYINDNVLSAPAPPDYTEVNYTSRSGFKAGVYSDPRKKQWSAYVQLEKYDSRSTFFLSPEDVVKLRELVTQAKTKMI